MTATAVTTGALWIVTASACSAAVGLLVKLSAHHASDVQIVFTCYGVGLLIVAPVALRHGVRFLATPHPRLQAARAVTAFVYFGSLFVAFRTIPLVDGILLRSMAPIWVPLLLWLIWHRPVPHRLWWGIAAGFVGVTLVLQPGYQAFAIGYPIAVGSGIAYALNSIAARRVNEAGEPLERTLFYSFLIPSVLMAVPAALTWQPFPAATWAPMIGTGVGTVAIVTCFVTGYRHAPAYLLAPFGYASVAFAALFDWVVFDHVPNALTVAGIVVITTACLAVVRLGRAADGAVSPGTARR